ncbi:MAG: DUF4199 domain-containing protein [Schleiferiaceae bacterium]|jgi:uncharacterized membrane protein (DUF106 family)
MDATTKRIAINYGLLVSAVTVGYTLVAYIINEVWLSSQVGGILMLLAMLVIPYFGVREFKKAHEGYATFREAFSAYVLPLIVSAVVGLAFNWLMHNVIDGELATRMGERVYERFAEMPEEQRKGVMTFMGVSTEAELKAESIKMTVDQTTIMGMLKSTGAGIIMYAIVGLIVAAVAKKNRPEFQ